MDLLFGYDVVVSTFVARHIPHCHRGFGKNMKAIGILDENKVLVGGLVFHDYQPETGLIEISGAATTKRWLTRVVLNRMFDYPFLECQCQMVVMRIRRDNHPLHRMLLAYGFKSQIVSRMFGRDVDGLLCTLTDDAWLSNKFNKKRLLVQREAEMQHE